MYWPLPFHRHSRMTPLICSYSFLLISKETVSTISVMISSNVRFPAIALMLLLSMDPPIVLLVCMFNRKYLDFDWKLRGNRNVWFLLFFCVYLVLFSDLAGRLIRGRFWELYEYKDKCPIYGDQTSPWKRIFIRILPLVLHLILFIFHYWNKLIEMLVTSDLAAFETSKYGSSQVSV